MASATAIAAIGAAERGEFVAHEMFDAGASVAAAAEYAYLVNKIAFFQNLSFHWTANIPDRWPNWFINKKRRPYGVNAFAIR